MEKKLMYSYDKKTDEMNLFFGAPGKSIGIDMGNEIFLQLEPKTRVILGITIFDFEKRIRKEDDKMQTSVPYEGNLFLSSKVKKQLIPA